MFPKTLELLRQLRAFRVLDPACGSGNFLFVAYRALRELEQNLLVKLFTQDKRQFEKAGTASGISPKQFFGLDVNDNAVETAKVTLMLARRLAARSAHEFWDAHADVLPGGDTHALQFERRPAAGQSRRQHCLRRRPCSRRGRKWTPSSAIRRFLMRAA
ncbi:MAG: DNA methyltransferase [Limisphaerales bacterium]